MALERYARGAWERDGVELHPGVEWRDGDDVEQMTIDVQVIAKQALWRWGGNHVMVAEHARELIEAKWPGRAFFIETEENGKGVQVFDPRDFVKERCQCVADPNLKKENAHLQSRLSYALSRMNCTTHGGRADCYRAGRHVEDCMLHGLTPDELQLVGPWGADGAGAG